MLSEIPIDPYDLPEYAGRLFDVYRADPIALRLATWLRLEDPDAEPPAAVSRSMRSKTGAIERAQREGALPARFTPGELLALVLNTAALWATAGPEHTPLLTSTTPTRRRTVVVESVRLLLTPTE